VQLSGQDEIFLNSNDLYVLQPVDETGWETCEYKIMKKNDQKKDYPEI
jgi:hypothetical protein